MADAHDTYQSPLGSRYAGSEMKYLFSDEKRFRTWRLLWIALAEAQRALGLDITEEQINELILHKDDINYVAAEERERQTRHDVMSHIYAYGLQCPAAKPIIHLGATSCYVTDNADIIIMAEALSLIRRKTLSVMKRLYDFAGRYKDMPALGFTHFQPAQLVTVGKRAALWLQDLYSDIQELDFVAGSLKLLGSKGTTGTQASFKALFDGDYDKVLKLESMIAGRFGLAACAVSGQTYSRKADARVMNALSSIAQSACKFANDLRLLQGLKELEEPFESGQVGSSAMAYKRNPMRCERMTGLCRFVISNSQNAAFTAAGQWLERTLDDSSNRRLAISEAFLAVDAILNIYLNVAAGLEVYPAMIARRVVDELPFMATENILMAAVRRGGDRQELHERLRLHSMEAARRVKNEGGENDLLRRIAADPRFGMSYAELTRELAPEGYTGFAARQTEEFLGMLKPLLETAEAADDTTLNV